MPLYDFACEHCATRFEELRRMGDAPPPCPACGSAAVRRLLSSFVAGPARKPPSTFTPATTRRDGLGGRHGHAH